ncbi:MAG: phage head closure protein, partial [Candidatus Hydrogenedentes bacterium]|nr:phage head closure protein [Candidatus Hydrogenedentota bacterium]
RFRHQVQLLRRVDTQLPGGQVRHSYAPIDGGIVWARIAAISGREFFAAAQVQSETTTRITIRWRDDIDETCRVRHVIDHSASPPRYDDYDIKAVIPDEKSGRRELVLMCAKSPAEGWRNTVITGSGEPLPPPEFTISWSQITDVPTEFPPSAHTHDWTDLTGVPATFPPSAHTHDWTDLTGVPATFPPSAHTHDWTDLTGVPATFPPSAHTHDWSDLTGVPVSFPPSAHTHDWTDLTGVPATFPPSAHTHSHGALSDLGVDDHAQYILVNGTRPFTGTQTTRALQPSATTTYDLGTSSMRYRTAYAKMLSAFSGSGSSVIGNNSSMAAFATQSGSGSTTVTSQSAFSTGSAFLAGAGRAIGGGTVTLSSIGLGSVVLGDAAVVSDGSASLSANGLGGCFVAGSAVAYTGGGSSLDASEA